MNIHGWRWIYLFAGRREYLTHSSVYRKRLVTTSLTPENILQYTHQSKAPPKMILFVGMMRVIGLPPFLLPLTYIRRGEGHLFICDGCLDSRYVLDVSTLSLWVSSDFVPKYTENDYSMVMAVFPTCCHSFVLAMYPSINVRAHKREYCKHYSR